MADEISIGSKAIKEIQELKDQLVLADNALLKLSQDALTAGKNISSISTPGGLTKSTSDNAKTLQELEALKVKYASLNDTIVKKAEQSRLSDIRLQQQREKAFDSFDKNSKREQAIIEKNASIYNKTQTQINTLTKAYNDLSVRKERYNNLTANEEMRLGTLQRVTEKYNGVLRTTDAQIGKNQRNVGNYASGWNGLGNSINQLTREAPAAAVSLNTFFLAISNNLPQFFDEITKLKTANEELVKSGEKPVSIWKQLFGAVFSFQTLLSVGVTLLTLYGGKLIDMALGLGDVEKQLKNIERAQKIYNSRIEDANRNLEYQAELEKIRLKSAGATEKQLAEIDVETQRRRLKNFEDQRDMANRLVKIEEDRILQREKLDKKLYQNTNTQNASASQLARISINKRNQEAKAIEAKNSDEVLAKLRENALKAENLVKLEGQKLTKINAEQNGEKKKKEEDWLKYLYDANRKELELRLLKQETILNGEFSTYKEQEKALIDANTTHLMLIRLDYNEQVRLAKGNANKIKSANLDMQMSIIKNSEDFGNKTKSIRKKENEENIAELNSVKKFIEDYQKDKRDSEQVTIDIETKNEEARRALYEKQLARLKELKKATKDYLNSFTEEFASNSGFGETFDTFFKQIETVDKDGKKVMTSMFQNLLDGTKNISTGLRDSVEEFKVYFNAISQTAQETFNFISDNSEKNFDEEKERLQSQYDIAFAFANGNKEAEEKLASDLEAKKKEIANREAKAKQKQAMFNIAIDTAQAIVSALPNIPLSIIIGALGAVQLAAVASQEIPQYWMGGTHDGGLMMVNDGSGSNYHETIVTPEGKIMQPKGRNVIMDAPAGTEIFTQDQWNNELQNMLQGKGISMNSNHSYSGISKSDLEEVMIKTLGSQSKHYTNFDANGASQYVEKRGNITKRNIARGNGRGKKY